MTSPTSNWNITTINGVQYLVIDAASFRVPLSWDPSSNMFIAVAAPNGAAVANLPALLQGAPGTTPTIDSTILFTELAYNDPTPASATFALESGTLYQLTLALHAGQPGPAGAMTLISPTQATDLAGSPLAGQLIAVNGTTNGAVFTTERVGDRFIPTNILSAPSGNPAYTLCPVQIPAMPWDYRPHCEGQTIVTGTGSDIRADLVVRVDTSGTGSGETAGNVVARGFGQSGQFPAPVGLCSAPPGASADGYDRITAGTPATFYLRVERQSGTNTFTTSNTTTLFSVRVRPVPYGS